MELQDSSLKSSCRVSINNKLAIWLYGYDLYENNQKSLVRQSVHVDLFYVLCNEWIWHSCSIPFDQGVIKDNRMSIQQWYPEITVVFWALPQRRVVLIVVTFPTTSCQWREMFVCVTSMQLSKLSDGFSYHLPIILDFKNIYFLKSSDEDKKISNHQNVISIKFLIQ